jgi:hypothetical protein
MADDGDYRKSLSYLETATSRGTTYWRMIFDGGAAYVQEETVHWLNVKRNLLVLPAEEMSYEEEERYAALLRALLNVQTTYRNAAEWADGMLNLVAILQEGDIATFRHRFQNFREAGKRQTAEHQEILSRLAYMTHFPLRPIEGEVDDDPDLIELRELEDCISSMTQLWLLTLHSFVHKTPFKVKIKAALFAEYAYQLERLSRNLTEMKNACLRCAEDVDRSRDFIQAFQDTH